MSALKIITLMTFLFIEAQERVAGVNITLIQIAAGILFLYIFVGSIVKRMSFKNIFKDKLILIGFTVYIGVMTLLIIYHSNSVLTIVKYIIVLLAGFVIFVDFYYQVESEISYESKFLILLVIAVFIIIYGLFTTPDVLAGPKRFDSIFWGRSNRMATRFLMLIPIAFYLGKYKNRLYYILFYILVLGIFMTISRGGILVLGVFLLLNVKDFVKKENIINTLVGFSSCVLILYKFKFLQSIFYRADDLKIQIGNNIGGGGAGSNSISRIQLWTEALKNFFSSPIFGIGIDKYQAYYMYYGEKVAEVNAHNWVLHLLAEVGIVGFIATLFLIIVLFYILYKRCRENEQNKYTDMYVKSKIGIWVLFIFLTHNLVEASCNSLMFGYGSVSVLLVVILGICIGSYKIVKSS